VRRIASFDPSGFASQIGGEAPVQDRRLCPKSYRKATKVMARDIELAVVAADDAFKDAGLQSKAHCESPSIPTSRFGCNIGAGLVSVDLNELTAAMHVARDGNRMDLPRWGRDGMGQLTPLWLLKYLPNMLACHVTIIHELKGPSKHDHLCDASSHLAIGEAFRTISTWRCGSGDLRRGRDKIAPMNLMRQTLLGRVTISHNDSPATRFVPSTPIAAAQPSEKAADY